MEVLGQGASKCPIGQLQAGRSLLQVWEDALRSGSASQPELETLLNMNKNILSLLAALSALTAVGADSFPYHPFRRIGTNSYDLRLLYTWRGNKSAPRAAANSGPNAGIHSSTKET